MDQTNIYQEWALQEWYLNLVKDDGLADPLRLLPHLLSVVTCPFKLIVIFWGRPCGHSPWEPGGRVLVTRKVMLTAVQVWHVGGLRSSCKTWYLNFVRLKYQSLCVVSCYIAPLPDHPSSRTFTSSLWFGYTHDVETLLSVYLLLLLLVPYLLSEISYICLQMKPSELPLRRHLWTFACGDLFHNFTFSIKAAYSLDSFSLFFCFLLMLFPFTLWSFPVCSSYSFPFFQFPWGCLL